MSHESADQYEHLKTSINEAFLSINLFWCSFCRSVISFSQTELPIYTPSAMESASKFNLYDSIDEEVLKSYNEFSLASLVLFAMKEGACSEQSSRMTAMDAASKNAGECGRE